MNKKSTCIITLPRTGSELLLNHLSVAYNLENGGEFLCQTKFNPHEVIKTESADIFRNSFNFAPLDTSNFTISKIKEFIKQDFNERLRLLHAHKTGVVVKTFIYSEYYKYFPIFINRILNEFNVIFLSRKHTYNGIISGFICEQLNVWHVLEDDSLLETKKRLSTLRFSINENKFIEIVQDTNIFVSCKEIYQRFILQ